MPETESPSTRVLIALESSVRTSEQILGQMKGLDREFLAFREVQAKDQEYFQKGLTSKVDNLAEEVRTLSSHLDNLVREAVTTNQLITEDMETRKEEGIHKRKMETEETLWRRSLEERKLNRTEVVEDDNRNAVRKAADEVWGVVKHPLGYLFAGIVVWLAATYFATPQGISPAPPSPQPSIEGPL